MPGAGHYREIEKCFCLLKNVPRETAHFLSYQGLRLRRVRGPKLIEGLIDERIRQSWPKEARAGMTSLAGGSELVLRFDYT